ncbi:hypothetical protein HDU91_005206 [Kappamyces sp. JEL0680]|nr:hypothetical protein HDU91_005206 [Kappamyces sp. JEL0680]
MLVPDDCPLGSYYCGDGKCHRGDSPAFACFGVLSPCGCSKDDPRSNAVPCKSTNVTIQYFANQDQTKLVQSCSSKLGLSESSQAYVQYCAPSDPAEFSLLSAVFVVFYLLAVAEVGLVVSYLAYRRTQLAKLRESTVGNVSTYANVPIVDQGVPLPQVSFTGYREDAFGSLVRHSVVACSVGWLVLLIVLIADYYAVFSLWVSEETSGLIFEDHDMLSKYFIIFWHFSTFWFLALQANKGTLKTLFLTKTDVSNATFILVEKARQSPVKFDDMGKLAEYAQQMEQWFRNYTNTNVSRELKEFQSTKQGKLYIEFECVRYIFNPKLASFEPFQLQVSGSNSSLHALSKGLTGFEAATRVDLSGPNEILFVMSTFWQGIVKEFSGIFYLYQFVMLQIWYFYAYYYMGMVLTAIIVGSGIVKVLVATAAQEKVLEMATFHGFARVLRDNRWIEIPSRDLAVGDVVEVTASGSPLSIDCVILSGDVVVDESSLTGEALPVTKFALKNDESHFAKEGSNKINCLFAGTNVLETQHENEGEKVTALVISTGGSTEKGKLVRDILYPVPFSFVFNEHLKIVFPILIGWGVAMLFLSIAMLESADIGSWFYGMFGISQVLSPILPAVLVIGQSVSSERLRSKGILCVDLNRITLAGKVKVFCFDKTGTLTKEGLEFMGVHEVNRQLGRFGDVSNEFSYFSSLMQLAMQTCHSISMVQGRPVGNFVDVEMFRASNGRINAKSNLLIHSHLSSEPIRVLKRFEFNHSHAYMSAVVQDTVTLRTNVFVKGSFEKVAALVDPATVPADYASVAKAHASQGYYVLAVATKRIETSPDRLEATSRDELEKGLELVGLMLFRNELKPDTTRALQELREGGCRTVMITGDNASTAVFIAKSSGMIAKDAMGNDPLVLMAEYIDEVGCRR